MDAFYSIWSLVSKKTQASRWGEWFRIPKVYRNRDEEKTEIARKQLALILDSPDRKRH